MSLFVGFKTIGSDIQEFRSNRCSTTGLRFRKLVNKIYAIHGIGFINLFGSGPRPTFRRRTSALQQVPNDPEIHAASASLTDLPL
ncbi:hypothetical protein AB1N83_008959 [Pleurotus pulmonarius]